MNKLLSTGFFCLILSFTSSCGIPDYTDEINTVYQEAKNADNSICKYGEYECHGNDSYFCGYSGNDLMWLLSQDCEFGCDESSGKCKNSSANNADPSDTGDTDSTDTEETVVPECSTNTTSFPCEDSSSSLIWSAKTSSEMTWQNAVDYCDNYSEGGYNDWHLPNIDELRTLLIVSRASACRVSEKNNCLSNSCWTCETCSETGNSNSQSDPNCLGTAYSDGRYSKFGDSGKFWSSSSVSDNSTYKWGVYFDYGYIYGNTTDRYNNVRCVRN